MDHKRLEDPGSSSTDGRRSGGLLLHVLLSALVLLLSAAVFGGAGFAIGWTAQQQQPPPHTAGPQPIDLEVELTVIEQTCSADELSGASDAPPSPACAAAVQERVAALAALVHAGVHPEGAAERGGAPPPMGRGRGRSRRWWWSSSSSSTPNCDGTWTGSCCSSNRPGPATGPSPLCRVIMDSNPGAGAYECSWWNPICHAFCSPYDEVQYCGYFDNK